MAGIITGIMAASSSKGYKGVFFVLTHLRPIFHLCRNQVNSTVFTRKTNVREVQDEN